MNSVGNLIRSIKDLEISSKNYVHDIIYYKYEDISYILQNGSESKQEMNIKENEYKKRERELIAFVDKFSNNYEKKSAAILDSKKN